MTVADLNQMEARVDIGEVDVVLIKPGQKAHVGSGCVPRQKFPAWSRKSPTLQKVQAPQPVPGRGSSSSQEATKFEVRIRINENMAFRPGMSVSTEIESRYVTNALLTVPYAAVTTRMPKMDVREGRGHEYQFDRDGCQYRPGNQHRPNRQSWAKGRAKQIEVVFAVERRQGEDGAGQIGISDGNHWEVIEGLAEVRICFRQLQDVP